MASATKILSGMTLTQLRNAVAERERRVKNWIERERRVKNWMKRRDALKERLDRLSKRVSSLTGRKSSKRKSKA